MTRLKDKEFRIISDLLSELYYNDDLKEIERKFLVGIRTLIPYHQASFYPMDPETGRALEDAAVFIDTREDLIPHFFASIAPEENYLAHLFHRKESIVYIESDILGTELYEKTEFYRNFLKPQGVSYGCGAILIDEGKPMGVISLFRGKKWGNFTEKEAFILELFTAHLTQITANLLPGKELILNFDDAILTLREQEIAGLIFQGYTNEEIATELCISVSTVKKHVYNIFHKYHVNNRTSLIQLLRIR